MIKQDLYLNNYETFTSAGTKVQMKALFECEQIAGVAFCICVWAPFVQSVFLFNS